MGDRENEEEAEERDIRQDQEQEEADRDVAGDEPGQRQTVTRFACLFDLVSRHMAGDDRDEASEAPGAEDRRGRERGADDGPWVVSLSRLGRRGRWGLIWQRRWRLHKLQSSERSYNRFDGSCPGGDDQAQAAR